MSLPRPMRMTSTGQYAKVRKEGKSRTGRHIIMAVLGGMDISHNQFGFTVTKRVGCAVERNRIKRRLREIARTHASNLVPGHWIVTIPRPGTLDCDFAKLRDEWIYLARKMGIWAEKK